MSYYAGIEVKVKAYVGGILQISVYDKVNIGDVSTHVVAACILDGLLEVKGKSRLVIACNEAKSGCVSTEGGGIDLCGILP